MESSIIILNSFNGNFYFSNPARNNNPVRILVMQYKTLQLQDQVNLEAPRELKQSHNENITSSVSNPELLHAVVEHEPEINCQEEKWVYHLLWKDQEG